MGIFSQLKESLARTRQRLLQGLDTLFTSHRVVDESLLEELEELLLSCDLGVKTTYHLLDKVRGQAKGKGEDSPFFIKDQLKEDIFLILNQHTAPLATVASPPLVIMMVGVNGVGKTTTIAKLAHYFRQQGQEVILAAADTFRPAAIEQLEHWSKRVGAELVRQSPGADPAAVAFDAARRAKSKSAPVLIVDTAGRLHTKVNLMEELKKMRRVLAREVEGAPHEVMLVIDATTGQNAIEQARTFHQALGITGITLAKLDGTAKGGIVVAIVADLGVPIKFVGIGEKVTDLKAFDPKDFVEALFT